jgi:hypothetical protein
VKNALVAAVILFSVAPARADFLYKLVGYECDAEADAVILTYRGAANEAGEKMIHEKGPQQWDPWSLIITTEDGSRVGAQCSCGARPSVSSFDRWCRSVQISP